MLAAWTKALRDIFRPEIVRILLLGIGLALVLLLALQAAAIWVLGWILPDQMTLPWMGDIDIGWASWSALALLPLMAIYLMGPVAAMICGLLSDEVAGKVEAIHYPHRRGRDVPLGTSLREAMLTIGPVLLVSLISLMATPFFGPLAPVVAVLANGWLLGREFYQASARRHLPYDRAVALRQAHSNSATAAGIAVAALLLVPVINIAVPILGTAAFTHLAVRHLDKSGRNPRHPPA